MPRSRTSQRSATDIRLADLAERLPSREHLPRENQAWRKQAQSIGEALNIDWTRDWISLGDIASVSDVTAALFWSRLLDTSSRDIRRRLMQTVLPSVSRCVERSLRSRITGSLEAFEAWALGQSDELPRYGVHERNQGPDRLNPPAIALHYLSLAARPSATNAPLGVGVPAYLSMAAFWARRNRTSPIYAVLTTELVPGEAEAQVRDLCRIFPPRVANSRAA